MPIPTASTIQLPVLDQFLSARFARSYRSTEQNIGTMTGRGI
jgi:hypothetical protein